jgi:integrase
MGLEDFFKKASAQQENVAPKTENSRKEEPKEPKPTPKVEWDGKDFRGDQCSPFAIVFLNEHPLVYQWLRSHPRNYIQGAVISLKAFCSFANTTPEKFLTLDKKNARDLLWENIDSIRFEHPHTAIARRDIIHTFYRFHNEEKLEFIHGKHDIVHEPLREKAHMGKDVCWKLIYKTRNLHDEALLTFAFESGLRRNAIGHLTYGHYKNFQWFGEIAVFKVMATPSKNHTCDNKLRGKGINWYYGCLHKEATTILKRYVEKYYQGSSDDTPFWRVQPKEFLVIVKACAKRANLKAEQINFHALRRGFRSVVRNTATITDNEFKEAIMGHKLKGSQENYFDKEAADFAREYSKCDFSPTNEAMEAKLKELEERESQLKEREAQKVEPQHNITNEDWLNSYLKDSLRGPTPEPIPTKETESATMNCQEPRPEMPSETEWIACPTGIWVKKQDCEQQCRTTTAKQYSFCQSERAKNANGILFRLDAPKPQ